MSEDMHDMFRQMDAMIASMIAQMNSGMADGMQQPVSGYRIIIQTSGGIPERLSGEEGNRYPQQPPQDAEVHRIGSEVKVVAELPGADSATIRLDVSDGVLTIEAEGRGQSFRKTAVLPPVDPASREHSFKNGVLEVTFAAGSDQLAG